jgi:hypothetical protein
MSFSAPLADRSHFVVFRHPGVNLQGVQMVKTIFLFALPTFRHWIRIAPSAPTLRTDCSWYKSQLVFS